MAERTTGQRTTIHFGSVAAEVSLVKTSAKPKAAQHETKTVLATGTTITDNPGAGPGEPTQVIEDEAATLAADPLGEPAEPGLQRAALAGGYPVDPAERQPEAPVDPLGETTQPDAAMERFERLAAPTGLRLGDLVTDANVKRVGVAVGEPEFRDVPVYDTDPETGERTPTGETERVPVVEVATSGIVRVPGGGTVDADLAALKVKTGAAPAPDPAEAPEYEKPPTITMQGVHRDDGSWVDLTARFEEVDQLTKLDGMHVVATIDATAVPRERVRDAYYVSIADPKKAKVLALLWHGLRVERRAAAVKWTKRTAQALGILVARGELGKDAHLLLLELEWAQNMRAVPAKASGPVSREVETDEVEAAASLVRAFASRPAALDELADDRLAKRAELLERAKAGTLEEYAPPAAPLPEADGGGVHALADLLSASASMVRERATA